MNVGAVLTELSSQPTSPNIVEDLLDAHGMFDADPSHALVLGLPSGDLQGDALLVGDLIANCVTALHAANE